MQEAMRWVWVGIAAGIMLLICSAAASTNVTLVSYYSVTNGNTLNVATGQLARVSGVFFGVGSGLLTVNCGGRSFPFTQSDLNAGKLPLIVGPAAMALTVSSNNGQTWSAFATVELSCPGEAVTPSTAVVIPSDSNGPVNIILESSTDLLNWTPALPGTYGTTETKRFFRVRAER